jgi:hypothetical protein
MFINLFIVSIPCQTLLKASLCCVSGLFSSQVALNFLCAIERGQALLQFLPCGLAFSELQMCLPLRDAMC